MERRARTSGLTGQRAPKVLRRYLRATLRRGLLVMHEHYNYFLVRGMTVPLEARVFLEAPRWTVMTNMVRYAFLELCSREIHRSGVQSDVAEVGVGEGFTAAALNHYFSDRRLLLFDTFSGFAADDLVRNKELGFGDAPYRNPEINVDLVLGRLPNPDQVEVYPGRFPDSCEGLEHRRFALVHIDVGLYSPTYAALRWFHDRLDPGGYMLVADYEHESAVGVKAAVQQFAEEMEVRYTVVPDWSGTAVFAL
jgi:O-methyltransferase